MFSTDIVAHGLDFKGVDWVVQMDCPEDVDTFIELDVLLGEQRNPEYLRSNFPRYNKGQKCIAHDLPFGS